MSEQTPPIAVLDLPFGINEAYPDGRSILPNSRPGYICLALRECGIDSYFVSQSLGEYDEAGFTKYWTVSDITKPHDAVKHELPAHQRLVGHAYRRRDGIDPVLQRLVPGFNSMTFCNAVQNRQAMLHQLGSWGIPVPHTAQTVTADKIGQIRGELADQEFVVVRPGKVGIDGLEVVLRRNQLAEQVAKLGLASISMQELLHPLGFPEVADALHSTLPRKEGLHSVRLYTTGTDTYAAELQYYASQGGTGAEASELFYPDEIELRAPNLYAANATAVSNIAATFPSPSSYMITWRFGQNAQGVMGWYAIEFNGRPYTPNLREGTAKQQAIAQATVTRGDVNPLRSLILQTSKKRRNAIVTLHST